MSLGKMRRYMPEEKQGLIYYACRNYRNLPRETQEKIQSLCEEVCWPDKYNSKALLAYLITDNSKKVSIDYYISVSQLNRLRGKFFRQVAHNGGQLGFIIKSG